MKGSRPGPAGRPIDQSVYDRLARYEGVNDAEPFQDPALRMTGSKKIVERGAARASRLQSFEAEARYVPRLKALNALVR